MSKISIVGSGAWGTTLSILFAENGHSVTLWSFEKEVTGDINEFRENKKYLNGFQLPSNVEATSDLKVAADAEIIVFVTPSQFLRTTAKNIAKFIEKRPIIASAVKGLEIETQKTMSNVIREELGGGLVTVISGPNISKEIARGLPAATVAASRRLEDAVTVQKALNSGRFRVYTNSDVTGVELGGALKNVISIAAGICDGLGFGSNAKAALMVRGMAEITRLGVALGGKNETFYGLSGMGDLITTCSSVLSRNHHVGVEIAKGIKLKDIKEKMYDVAEGVPTAKAAKEIAKKLNIDMPITTEIYSILYENKDANKSMASLMQRDLKNE